MAAIQRNKRYRLCDVEEAISKMDELIDVADDIAEIDDDTQIIVSGWSVYVESLNLTLRHGIVCVWDKEAGLFMPDADMTVVYEGKADADSSENAALFVNEQAEGTQSSCPADLLFYEQAGMLVALGDWLNGRLPDEQIEQLWCELIVSEM